ncbi:hypothetical protein [Streptomyces sp. NPDC004291]
MTNGTAEYRVYEPADAYLPQYRQSGDRVDLHLRMGRIDGAPWTNGQAFLILPPHLRPNRTQSLVGATTGKGDNTGALTVRLEITTDGKPCVFDERGLTGWIGPDAGHFTT